MKCKIGESESNKIFEKIVLLKYNVNYYKCSNCSFVQTDEPFWLKEAYQSPITSLDIGILIRNNSLVTEVSKIIDSCFAEAKKMLDSAGGYGIFTRMMRDIGYDFYRQDIYCENLFANYFDITDCKEKKFDIVTAFEVLEHFSEPMKEIETIFNYSENAIFSTDLTPTKDLDIENWVYISLKKLVNIYLFIQQKQCTLSQKNLKEIIIAKTIAFTFLQQKNYLKNNYHFMIMNILLKENI